MFSIIPELFAWGPGGAVKKLRTWHDNSISGSTMEINKQTVMVLGLAKECPRSDKHDNCPLRDIRALGLKGRCEAVRKMGSHDVHAILEHHDMCIDDPAAVTEASNVLPLRAPPLKKAI